MLQYDWTSRNEESQKVLNLVVCAEIPSEFGKRRDGKEVYARFADGSSCSVVPESSSIAWLERGKQPRRIQVKNLDVVVSQIEANSSALLEVKFTGPEDFLARIEKAAEQVGRGDGVKPPN